jgi:hypothetical protein
MPTDEKKQPNESILQVQAPKRQGTWYFVTNQLNLMYMLAAGMIMPPKGFGKKYYEDSLNVVPGWIPLFAGTVPRRMLDTVVKENANLRPVIVALDLSSLKGPARAVSMNGKIRDIQLPEDLTALHSSILVPAPLPTTFIESICFSSKEDKTASEQDATDYANVPLGHFKRGIQKRLFGRAGRMDWPIQQNFSEKQNVSMDTFLAAGGMMAMLLNCGNMGDFATLACQTAFDGVSGDGNSILDGTVVQGLGYWMRYGIGPTSKTMSNDLYWGIVNQIVQLDMGMGYQLPFKEAVLDFLNKFKEKSDPKYREVLSELISDLSELEQFGAKNATELLESHPREVRRAFILFFLRNRCADLIDFSHPLLTERDYIAAALLFAAREKWIGLPLHMRGQPGLDQAVSHRMAAMAHQVTKTDMNLGPPPPRCLPLRELLSPGPEGWTKMQADAALCLTRDMKWPCISTRIRIGRGEYAFTVDAGGINIYFPGEIRAVDTEIEKEKFFKLMADKRFIDQKNEKKARKFLPN